MFLTSQISAFFKHQYPYHDERDSKNEAPDPGRQDKQYQKRPHRQQDIAKQSFRIAFAHLISPQSFA